MAQQQEFTDFEVQVDLNNVDAWGGEGFQLAPAGDFELTITNLEQKSSKSQQPMIVATFEIATEGEHKGTRVWNNYSLQQQSLGRLKQLSVACGAQLDKFVASQHIGATIRATIVHVDGQPTIGPDGTPKPARVFANVTNEMPLEEAPAQVAAAPTPPVMRGKPAATPPVTQKPTTNGAPRRA